ncbi:hypothetical protein EOD39_3207 [Acipenser ruthenus]|uniref:Uncharacterized protein n=1 Tax=Acipenser ruthenus TaxID=7906 RepID=A0A444UPJ0_ACIRT|nr:hypothetical protein EOD39_3207 [Acipenser ruthenus]
MVTTATPHRVTTGSARGFMENALALLLCLITALRQGCFNLFDDIVMETLCLTAAFGFLRCAEFLTPSTSSFPALGLKRSDLSQIPGNHFILHIRFSKTVQLS